MTVRKMAPWASGQHRALGEALIAATPETWEVRSFPHGPGVLPEGASEAVVLAGGVPPTMTARECAEAVVRKLRERAGCCDQGRLLIDAPCPWHPDAR